jgi:hypothetical protein
MDNYLLLAASDYVLYTEPATFNHTLLVVVTVTTIEVQALPHN